MKNYTKKTLQYYFKAVLKYKLASFFIILVIVIASAVGPIIPLFVKKFIDILSVGSKSPDILANDLIRILFYILGLNAITWVCWRIATFTASYLQAKVAADLTNKAFAYLHKHSFSFFKDNFVGSLVKRVKWFSNAFVDISGKIIWNILPLTISISVIIIVLFKRNIYLGLAISGWLFIFLLVNVFFTRYKLKYDIERAKKESETTAVLADTITNHNNVQLFGGYRQEIKNFGAVVEQFRKIRKFTWNLSDIFEAVQGFLMVAFEFGLMYLAVRLWQKGILTIGDFVLIQAYLFNIFHRIWDFGKTIRKIYESLADAEEMTIILNRPHDITDILKAKKLKVNRGEIEFQNVDFFYHQTRKILKNFNLKIASKERLALIGPSGAGKTTVVKLLLRTSDVSRGEILIDNQNIAKITQESLRQNISLVPQDPILFHRSLVDNIRYGKPSATDKQVIEAAKKAYCHQFIVNFSEGYNTFVGERGVKLSGGERQRVAIARAILRDAPILILDEATSSLDSISEGLIQKAMEKLMQDKTVIVIAHRLSTIRKMDRIVVIDKGQIIEQGTHQDLIAKAKGKYRALWDIQAGSFME